MDSNKRVILAVSLSLMVLLGWNYFFPPITPLETETQNVTAPNQTVAQAPESGAQTAPAASSASSPPKGISSAALLWPASRPGAPKSPVA